MTGFRDKREGVREGRSSFFHRSPQRLASEKLEVPTLGTGALVGLTAFGGGFTFGAAVIEKV